MATVGRVLARLRQTETGSTAPLEPGTALISSGRLDSLALFELSLWIEAELGAPIDFTVLDIAMAWETPALIADFIDAHKKRT